MITLFGKKKKEDEKKDTPASSIQPVTSLPPRSATAPAGQEESPFAKIFQSISQDYQNSNPPTRPESVGAPPLSVTPDWVQPRELPRSKPMVISPGGGPQRSPRAGQDENWENKREETDNTQTVKTQTSPPPLTPPTPTPQPSPLLRSNNDTPMLERSEDTTRNISGENLSPAQMPQGPEKSEKEEEKRTTRSATSPTFTEGISSFDSSGDSSLSGFEELSKLLAETDSVLSQGREKERELAAEKPVRPSPRREPKDSKKDLEKQPSLSIDKQSKDKTKEKRNIGFEHISELTQGKIDTVGLVVIDGPSGAGKTTLCLGLADHYLKQGSPCIFVTYSQTPLTVRDELKKLGCNVAQYESNYRFMIIDAYTAQSGGFSMEIYSLMDPWDIQKLQENLTGNTAIFMGERVRVFIDSLDGLVSKIGPKDFAKQFDPLVAKLKETGATIIASVDLSSAGKEINSWAEDDTDCVIEVDKEKGRDGIEHSLTVNRLKGEKVKVDPEEWDIQPGKGLVFVQ